MRRELCRFSRDLTSKGLLYGDKELAHGQLSVKVANTGMLIKPTNHDSATVKLNEWVLVDLGDGKVIKGGKPSSETDIHRAIYNARRDAGAIVHAHSMFAIALSTANREIVPWSDESLLLRGVRMVPRVDYDRERQTKLVLDALGQESRCVIIRHHGTISLGADLEEASLYALECERAAKIMYFALLLNSSAPLTKDEATKILGKPPLIDY